MGAGFVSRGGHNHATISDGRDRRQKSTPLRAEIVYINAAARGVIMRRASQRGTPRNYFPWLAPRPHAGFVIVLEKGIEIGVASDHSMLLSGRLMLINKLDGIVALAVYFINIGAARQK